MGNVVGINGHVPSKLGEPQQALIEMLEDMLDKAKSGELQSLIGTGFVADGQRLSVWFDHHENVYEMMGALSWLQHEYADRITEALSNG